MLLAKKRFIPLALLAFLCVGLKAQEQDVFVVVERQCPGLPAGLLRAISFTNTHCHHLTDADYTSAPDDPEAMPRAYGLMGLVKDGKGCFRENLKTVSAWSGYSQEAILGDPETNVMAYAKALMELASQKHLEGSRAEDFAPLIVELSELPVGAKKDELPLKMMLYSVYDQLGVDLKALFGEDYAVLSAQGLSFSKETDYPSAIWVPAPDCNFGERTTPVSGVVIHYTEGSYAGCISWFQNCVSSVSAHYVIRSSDGQVTQMVRECDKAWHARSANAYTIGVEHEAYGDIVSYFTEAMYASSADLMRDICSRYETIDGHRTFYRDTLDDGRTLNKGLHDLGGASSCVKIRGHQHYPDQSHTDPGPYWDWNYYYKLINEVTPVVRLGGAGATEGDLNHENYADDERKIWVIEGASDKCIALEFSSFELEKDFDFLWIYDGDDVYAPKLGRWNTMNPGVVKSSSNKMCVEFRSDCATTAAGWKAHWHEAAVLHADTIHIGSHQELLLEVYPNPVGDQLQIRLPDTGYYDVKITDLLGTVMYKGRFWGSSAIDVSQLPQGTYLLMFKRLKDGAVTVKRFIR